jgi:hypothetical protein
MPSAQSQTDFDISVQILFLNKIKYCTKVSTMRRQNDPAVFTKEEYLMMFDNIMYSLRDYDVTSELLTDDEIEYLYELGTQISLNWPI